MIDIQTLLGRIETADYKDILIDPEIGQHPNQSEFLIFLKPEIFMGEKSYQEKRIGLINDKLEEFDVTVDGMIAVGGRFMEEKGMMASHYGLINQMSNNASTLVTTDDRKKMTELLGENCADIPVLGGHEALKRFPSFTPESLDEFWFTKQSLKVKSGFYFQKYAYEGITFLLVDAFHPYQLHYFTQSDRRTLLLVCHSMTPWKKLRWDMIGATFPEKANPTSIRGQLYAKAADLGYTSVSIANNGVHFSVGPFEGMTELANFIGKALESDVLMQTDMAKDLIAAGVTAEQIIQITTNPLVTTADGVAKDLWGLTEDMEPEQAVEVLLHAEVR